ncbi:MAG TPA: hypothetical protein VGK89_14890 [Candidatus Eisenbacteria bacterium]
MSGAGLAPLAALALVLAATLLLRLPALDAPFFADDFIFLDQVGRGSLPHVLAEPDPIGNFYRPVGRQLFFWLVARAGSGSARAFHAAGLLLWLGIVALLFALARRLAGPRAALIAAGFLALHYAADVPLRWASGSQDLLAVVGALAALWLHLAGRRLWAGVALLAALLSKEVVALTPVVAVIAARRPGESWPAAARRAWPLAAAVAAWAVVALLAARARAGSAGPLTFGPAAVAAAFLHLLQVVPALEWGASAETRIPLAFPALVPLALVLVAIAAPGSRSSRPAAEPAPAGAGRAVAAGSGRAAAAGLVWALVGAAPVVPVAGTWSAYYYLFATCGAALALGAWLAPRRRAWGLAAVTLLAWNSARSSLLPEFALRPSAWNARSRINRYYLERGTFSVYRTLAQLRAARPALPPRSTLFFAGIPGSVAFQSGDGPLVRWAYRDTSLRSYYLGSFDRAKAVRGPVYFFQVTNDTLREVTSEPGLYYRLAASTILSEKPGTAREFLAMERERQGSPVSGYWLAWTEWGLGERERALDLLERAGYETRAGPVPEVAAAFEALARRDTAGALATARSGVEAHALDPGAHALLADLLLASGGGPGPAVIESYAARVLDPDSPAAWRRWGLLQISNQRILDGATSLRRYFALAGAAADRDLEARRLWQALRERFPSAAGVLDAAPPH